MQNLHERKAYGPQGTGKNQEEHWHGADEIMRNVVNPASGEIRQLAFASDAANLST
ncbi:MAG: hypothetical protein ACRCXD_14095 [Luteolibacter sp.]